MAEFSKPKMTLRSETCIQEDKLPAQVGVEDQPASAKSVAPNESAAAPHRPLYRRNMVILHDSLRPSQILTGLEGELFLTFVEPETRRREQ